MTPVAPKLVGALVRSKISKYYDIYMLIMIIILRMKQNSKIQKITDEKGRKSQFHAF